MSRILIALFAAFAAFWGSFAFAQAPVPAAAPVEFSVFTRAECAHCQALENFLEKNLTNSGARPKYYRLEETANQDLFAKFTADHGVSKITPIILVGKQIFEGYESDETTGARLLAAIRAERESSYFESASGASTAATAAGCSEFGPCLATEAPREFLVKIPGYGTVDIAKYSLPALAVLLGFVDGFNPCAMWVLVMFLSILSQTGSRRKMIEIVGVFVFAEAVMYFLILNVWYKTWDFVTLDHIVTPLIGLLSVGAGGFFLYEFFTNKDGECKVTTGDQKKKLAERVRAIANAPMTIGVLVATVGIAFSVNVIEFACSVGIPQAFTKLLEMSDVGFIAKQGYIALYTLFYMVDDFVVFGVAIYAFSYLHLTTQYTRYCLLLGGAVMLVLGYFFLFDPAFLRTVVG
jgi:cytochrome c biogenesis protein CcdA